MNSPIFFQKAIRQGAYALFLGLFGLTVVLRGQESTNVRFTQGDVNESATLSLGVPIGSYKGRGIDLPISLTYSSSVWNIEHLADVYNHNTYSYNFKQSITQAEFAKFSTSGWKSALDLPIIEFPKSNEQYDYKGKPSTTACSPYRVAHVTIHMPDGSTHELRKSDTPHTLGYVDMSGTFYAVDGSRIRFDANGTANTGTIYMPDGTRYVLGSTTSYIIDRNGNTLTYNHGNRQWTDTLGRVIANPLPATPTVGDFTYNLPGLTGVNGGVQAYTFKWKELEDALTPIDGSTPSLRVVAKHYLPYPQYYPTNDNQPAPATNYPLQQSSEYQYLFETAYPTFEEEPEHPLPVHIVGKGQSAGQLFNPVVLTEIVLPDGTSYKFSYNVYGELDKVVYPTNAYDKYEYGLTVTASEGYSQPYTQAQRNITSRTQSIDGSGNDLLEWKFYEESGKTSIVAPDLTRTEIYKIEASPYPALLGFSDSQVGSVVEKRFYSTSTNGLGGNLLRREMTQYEQTSNSYTWESICGVGPHYFRTITAYRNPRPNKHVSIIFEGSGSALAQTSTFSYDTTNQFTTGLDQTGTATYHYAVVSNTSSTDVAQAGTIGNIPTGSLAKTTETTFLNDSAYQDLNILGLPTLAKVKNGSATVVSQSQMSYDDEGYVPEGTTRGLPTTRRTWDSTKGLVTNSGAYLETHATFDEYGNRTIATDAKGYTTTTTYDSTYHAFPVSVTSPIPDNSGGVHGSTSAFVTTTTYDTSTPVPLGLVKSTTDANGQMTSIDYNDPLLRPTKVTAPNGHQTITEYGPPDSNGVLSASQRWVKVKAQIDSSIWSEAKSFYDGIGRTYKTQKTDSGGDVFTVTEYDIMGRVKATSNPFRNVTNPSCDTNLECSRPEYDDLSRTKKIISADADDVQISYGLSTSSVIGTTKTITDQAGRQRTGITDALGNMVRVIEDPDGSALVTDYVFDTLGNLRKTTQGEQTRYFHYDSLGRLLRAKQPEQDTNSALALSSADPITSNNNWSVGYTYDDNGNIETTTDARNITITATYDRLGRIKVRDYSDPNTPDVSFYYDGKYLDANDQVQTATGSVKGKTTGVKSSVSRTNYIDFDAMGRLEKSQQITDGQTYGFEYAYNLSGALIEETYPSGRKVQNVLDADGNLETVRSKKNALIPYWAYADKFTYDASGAVTKMQLGNGLWETASYDPERLQVKMLGLGTTETTQNLLKLEFGYTTTPTSADNNGSMREQKITVPAVGSNSAFTATQPYTYDSLNRIHDAEEKISGTTKWKQTFKYDRFGNRRFDTTNTGDTTTLGTCPQEQCNPLINTSDNRMQENQDGDSELEYDYDENGALTKDATGKRFGYDAESHQKEFFSASNSSSTPDATYQYDGDGRRVKKIVGSEVTIFVYNASGQLAAEYTTTVEPATTAQVSYLTTDHLGSPRITTDKNGGVISRKDFTTFGEEVTSTERVSGTNGNGYNAPEVRQDYTGYQKDEESGLEFAQARYYNTKHGRFTSVDPLTASAETKNPQTFNRYSYVTNSPYKFTDPLGLMQQGTYSDTGFCGADSSYCTSGGFDPFAGEAELQTRQRQNDQTRPKPKKKTKKLKQPKAKKPDKPPPPATPPASPGVTPSEKWMAEQFGNPGAYFSNPNDGDPIDQTTGTPRNDPNATKDPHNHLYPSIDDPNASSGFYVPDGGQYVGESTYTDGSGEKVRVIMIYFARLGGLSDVTVAAFHVVNINTSMPRDENGRRKLGDLGHGAGGSWSYGTRDTTGRMTWTRGVHAHLEVYRGKHTSLPALGNKPHTNFNSVVP
jgi:RHS repeat-associated protein